MLKMINDFSHTMHDALPAPVAAGLDKVATIPIGTVWTTYSVTKEVYRFFQGDPDKREMKEEAALLGRMRREPEELRSVSPGTCKKAREVSDRLLLRTTQSNPSVEVISDLRALMANSVDQCVWCPKPPK